MIALAYRFIANKIFMGICQFVKIQYTKDNFHIYEVNEYMVF